MSDKEAPSLSDLWNAPSDAPTAATPAPSATDIINGAAAAPASKPLVAQAETTKAQGATEQPQPAVPSESPGFHPEYPPGMQYPPIHFPDSASPQPMQMPQAPAPISAPAPTPPLPGMQAYQTPKLTAQDTAPIRERAANRYFEKNADGKLNGWDQFLLGTGHGAVTVGAEGKSLIDYLTGHVSTPQEDWQNQYEAGIPKEAQEGLAYKVGDVVGQTGAYGVLPAAAAIASPIEVPAAAATGAAIGFGALEGTMIGAAGAAHEKARKGETASAKDVAIGAGLGTAMGAAGGAAGIAAAKALQSGAKKVASWAHKFFDETQTAIVKAEHEQLANAQAVLDQAVAPVTSIAKKQIDEWKKLIEGGIGRNVDSGALKRGPGGRMLKRPTEFARKAEPKPQIRGIRKGKGYQRAYDATPIEKILPQLPTAIAKPFEAAVKELAEAKLAVENLRKRMIAYAENAIKLAKDPADSVRISKEVIANGELRSQPKDSLSKVRAYLFGEMQKLQAMTDPLAAVKISTTKHVHVDADATQLDTKVEPLKHTFVAAAKQAEEANRLLKNAETYLEGLRDRHQGLFQQVDDHLGKPTAVRVITGHDKFGPSQTVVSVGQQFDSSKADLAGRWLEQFNNIKRGIEAVERNWKEKITYNVAHKGRRTFEGAEKLLSDAGLIHPTAKSLLLAGALGIDTFNGRPAHAAGTEGVDKIEKQEAGITPMMVGALLAHKFGHAAAKKIARSGRFALHFLYEDTQRLAGMADEMMAGFRGEALHELDSLANAMNEYRGKLMEMQFVCPDAHGLMARALADIASPEELALLTPQGHQFLGEVNAMKKSLRSFVTEYHKEFNEGMHGLSESEKSGTREIHHAVNLVKDVLAPSGTRSISGGDWLLQKVFAQSAAFNFTLNWKIATTAWLHDMAAYGGMQLGIPSVYAAYAQYTASPTLRKLVSGFHIGGAATEAAQDLNKAAKVYTIEAVHNQLALLGSLNRQYRNLSQEQIHHLGVTSANDFAEKVMTRRLPRQTLARVFQEAGLDVSRATGADSTRLNQTGMERALQLGNITKYTRYIMIDQRLVKENLQAAATHFWKGETALGLQRMGRLAHAMTVKAQYAGARGVIPVTAFAALLSNPYTSQATAQVANAIDNISLGLKVFGDLGEHGRWDPVISPLMGQRLPGFDDSIEAFKQVMSLQSDINKMTAIIGSGDPMALLTGSKTDEDVKKGQQALVTLLGQVGFLFPKIGALPTRFIRDSVKALPDFINKEFMIGAPSPWPIGEKTKPAQSAKLFGYAAYPDQTQEGVDAEAAADGFGELFGRKPGVRSRRLTQQQYVKNANRDTEADVAEPEDVAGLVPK